MPKFSPELTENLQTWALAQPLFFTATAPLNGKHVNISPKGLPASCLSIPTLSTLLYLDVTGSGCETISHLYENGRITIMFLSFDKSPRIMRLFCTGRVIEAGTAEYNLLLPSIGFGENAGGVSMPSARAIVYCDIFKVQTSCGYGVPLFMEGRWEDRGTLGSWGKKTVEEGKLEEYQESVNIRSLDGLPGLRNARRRKGEWTKMVEGWVVFMRVWGYLAVFLIGLFLGMVLISTGAAQGIDIWNLQGKGFMSDW